MANVELVLTKHHVKKGLFFYAVVIILLALFLATIVEGATIQMAGDSLNATIYYIIGAVTIIATVLIFKRARKVLAAT